MMSFMDRYVDVLVCVLLTCIVLLPVGGVVAMVYGIIQMRKK